METDKFAYDESLEEFRNEMKFKFSQNEMMKIIRDLKDGKIDEAHKFLLKRFAETIFVPMTEQEVKEAEEFVKKSGILDRI